MTESDRLSDSWDPNCAKRRRWVTVAAALIFIAAAWRVGLEIRGLSICLRDGNYGGGMEVFLERDGVIRRTVIYLDAVREESGPLVSERISMQIMNPNGADEPIYLPFRIRSGDYIARAGWLDPEFEPIGRFGRTWQNRDLPVGTLIGNHAIGTDWIRGRTSLRPSILIGLAVLCGLGALHLLGLAGRQVVQLRRFERGKCPQCAYPLMQTDGGGVCPECGVKCRQ